MIGKKLKFKKSVRTRYYLTPKEVEKVYCKLYSMDMTPSKYADTIGISRGTFLAILYNDSALSKKIYIKAFKDLNCLDKVPEGFDD